MSRSPEGEGIDEGMEELPVVWDGDHLVVTDDDALAKIDRPYLSPSSAQTITSCPARFAIEKLLPRIDDPFSPAEIGTSGHSLLEELYGLPTGDRTLRRARNILNELAVNNPHIAPTPNDPHRTLRWKAAVWRKTRGIFRVENPSKVVVRAREWEMVNVEVAGVPFRGFIDRLDITTTEHTVGVSVVDYKTGRYQRAGMPWGDSNGDQMRLYVAAVRYWDGRAPIEARLIYTGESKQRFVSLSEREMHSTLTRFADAWDVTQDCVSKAAFATKGSALCPYCPLVTSCPTARANGIMPHPTNTTRLIVPHRVHLGPDDPPGDLDLDDRGPYDDTPHMDNTTTQSKEGTIMLHESKPWDETAEGGLNPNSYAAMGVFGIVELAVSHMEAAGVNLTKTGVDAFAQTCAAILFDCQGRLTGDKDWQAGANSRLRGALRTSLETYPAPFGESTEAWEAWVTSVTRRTNAIAAAAVRLWESTPNPDAWAHFAVDEDEEFSDAA